MLTKGTGYTSFLQGQSKTSLYTKCRLHDHRVQPLALGENKFLFTQFTVFSYSSVNRHRVFPGAKSKLHTDALGGMIQDGF